MVWTKAKTIIVGVGILVVAGTGVVIVKSNFLPTDATIRQLVVGSWKPVMPASSRVETSTEMKSDGKFVTKVTTVRTGITNILGYDGSWELKDGYITTQITNITVGDESQLPPRVERVRVVQIDGHQMVMRQDGSRNLNRMERK